MITYNVKLLFTLGVVLLQTMINSINALHSIFLIEIEIITKYAMKLVGNDIFYPTVCNNYAYIGGQKSVEDNISSHHLWQQIIKNPK